MILPASTAPAEDAAAAEPRWGVGWNGGLAVHRFVESGWGLGLAVSPRLSAGRGDLDRNPAEPYGTTGTELERTHRESWRAAVELAGYRQHPLTRWFLFGPYASLGWSHETIEDRQEHYTISGEGPAWLYQSTIQVDTQTARRFTAELGLRPVFRIHRRLLLETRFGISYSWSDTDLDRGRREYAENFMGAWEKEESDHLSNRARSLRVTGADLGVDSLLRFLILF